jgi:hypothetical protein
MAASLRRNTYAYSNSYSYRNTNGYSDTDRYSNSNHNSSRDCHRDTDCHSNGNSRGYTYRDANAQFAFGEYFHPDAGPSRR